MTTFDQSKRVKAFRRELIATVPRFPNDKVSLRAMEAKELTDLLITFIGWRIRFVAQRPRKVTGRENLAADARATTLQPNIDAFIVSTFVPRQEPRGPEKRPFPALKNPKADRRRPRVRRL